MHICYNNQNTYIEFGIANKNKYPEFKVGNHIRISKYKTAFAKGYTPNWSEEDFVIAESLKHCVIDKFISDINDKGIAGTFYEKESEKANQE